MGILSKLFKPKEEERKQIKEVVSESVHKDKNEFTGAVINSQSRMDAVDRKTDKLQEEFRRSVAYQISIRTGRSR